MVEVSIAVLFVSVLGISSLWADRRFLQRKRLPMQWSFAGAVNWTAPRRLALTFTPVLAAIVLGGTALLVLVSGDPRPGQEGFGPPVLFLIGLAFAAIHALHLWMIERTAG